MKGVEPTDRSDLAAAGIEGASPVQLGLSEAVYGVRVSRLRCDRAGRYERTSTHNHMVWLQLSDAVPVTTRVSGRRLRHQPGRRSLGLARAGSDSTVEIGGPVEGIVVSVAAECLALAAAQTLRHGGNLVERLHGRDDTLFDLARVLEAESHPGRAEGSLYRSSAVDALIRRLAERHLESGDRLPEDALDARTLRRLDAYILANLASPPDLSGLAAVAGQDLFRFARAFRKATGVTPHRYVTRLRLDRARALMREGDRPLADIALATGFCDQSHMNRWVRRVYGSTPGAISGRRRACKDVQDRRRRRMP